jgi:hypothetical protein
MLKLLVQQCGININLKEKVTALYPIKVFERRLTGIRKIITIQKTTHNLNDMLQTSMVLFIKAQTACVLTAETVDLLLYKLFNDKLYGELTEPYY